MTALLSLHTDPININFKSDYLLRYLLLAERRSPRGSPRDGYVRSAYVGDKKLNAPRATFAGPV
jgi:hypothetical protein